MRSIAILTFLFIIPAVVLSVLCIFASYKPGFMDNSALINVNTSRIGFNYFQEQSNTSTDGLPSWLQPLASLIGQEVQQIEQNIQNALNNDLDSIAKTLGLADFYSLSVLGWCRGYYSPSGSSNKNVTYCTSPTTFYDFNITLILQDELDKTGLPLTLQDLQWPSDVEDGFQSVQSGLHAAFVFYCLGASFAFVSLLGSIVGLYTNGWVVAFVNSLLDGAAVSPLFTASVLATIAQKNMASNVDKNGASADISAYYTGGFLGLTWTSTVLMFVAQLIWTADVITLRKRQKKHKREMQEKPVIPGVVS